MKSVRALLGWQAEACPTLGLDGWFGFGWVGMEKKEETDLVWIDFLSVWI